MTYADKMPPERSGEARKVRPDEELVQREVDFIPINLVYG